MNAAAKIASDIARLDREITDACLRRDMATAYEHLVERRALEAEVQQAAA
jgi:hypothetical protein